MLHIKVTLENANAKRERNTVTVWESKLKSKGRDKKRDRSYEACLVNVRLTLAGKEGW